jgi:hypothetical protein
MSSTFLTQVREKYAARIKVFLGAATNIRFIKTPANWFSEKQRSPG